MLLSALDYELPPDRIAQAPLEDRAASKLLHLDRRTGTIVDRTFRDLVGLLEPPDLLVFNNTRVSALRLMGRKPTGAKVEALLLEDRGAGAFAALLRPGRRLKPGATIEFGAGLQATVTDALPGARKLLTFEPVADLPTRLSAVGSVPLPPYITRALADPGRYQTVYAEADGSAAAPTAGLHFTAELLVALREKGVQMASVTLDVGIDTFRPVQVEDLDHHRMHGERCTVPEQTACAIAECKGRILAVGTTTTRTLETFAVDRRRVDPGTKVSKLFVRPGYRYRIVDGMLTNFHLPQTTMLLMVSALCSPDDLRRSYAHALSNGYRFLSFGDAMLVV